MNNIEHRIMNIEFYVFFIFALSLVFCAVLILVTKIEISSLHSLMIALSLYDTLINGLRLIILRQIFVSLNSFKITFILWIKSFFDSELWTSP